MNTLEMSIRQLEEAERNDQVRKRPGRGGNAKISKISRASLNRQSSLVWQES